MLPRSSDRPSGARALSVVSRKYDGRFRFATEVQVVCCAPRLVLGVGMPGRRFVRDGRVERRHDLSLEYLPLDRPFNIVSFFDSASRIVRHFCNILTEQRLADGVLSYVDLDLDVVVTPDGRYSVEDREEFERNSEELGYPDQVRALAEEAVGELVRLAESGGHVFGCESFEEARERMLELYCDGARAP